MGPGEGGQEVSDDGLQESLQTSQGRDSMLES